MVPLFKFYTMKIIGIVLIIAGILMLVFKGFNFTTEKKVVDIGPVEINKKENHTVSWPYYVGGICVVAGAVMAIAGTKKKGS